MSFISKNLNLPCVLSLLYNILCVTYMLCYITFSIAQNNETDRLALLEIRAKLNDPLGVMSSWNNTLHFCEWHGVTCGRRHQRVTALNLLSYKLSGTISPYVGNLSFLRVLNLTNNSLSGTIPTEISRLQRLQILKFENNSIGGEIPKNISKCYNLVDINLAQNKLEGVIPLTLGSLWRLKFLNLNKNNLGGHIPSSVMNLSRLAYFSLWENNLIGRISDSLGKLKYLDTIELYDNMFSGEIPPSIFNLSLLTRLDISMNNLEGNLPPMGGTLFPLETFIMFSNRLTGQIPTSISNSSNLMFLDLSENNFQGQVPSLNKLTKLSNLVLHKNFLGFPVGDLEFVYSLANATDLTWLEIGANYFTGAFPRIICNFSSLARLTLTDIYNLTGEIPNCIENLSKLYILGAANTSLTGTIPPGIRKLQSLSMLQLGGTQMSGSIPDLIDNMTKLSVLDLVGSNFDGHIPLSLGKCQSLIYLSLSNNRISGNIPAELFSLPSISVGLYLSENNLTGSLPKEVGQLNNLNTLDISQNMLSGQIPSSLGSCDSLEFLDMSENNFHGTIPQTPKGVLILNLSHNNLSGQIPKFLATLKLQNLDISHNHFNGEVPIGGVFNNTGTLSIFGNTGLCGGVAELMLPHCNFGNTTQKMKHTQNLRLYAILSALLGAALLVGILVFIWSCWWRRGATEPKTSNDTQIFPNLSYQTLLQATNGFTSENLVGSGTFGVVYKGIVDKDRAPVAIKIFKLDYHGALKSFVAECRVLQNIKHRNLVKVITACSSVDFQGRDFKALIYEYMKNGSLEDWLHPTKAISSVEDTANTTRKLSLHQRLSIVVDVACALDYLHNHCSTSVVHCDLKPSNVLLDDEMVARVSDFGLARFLQNSTNTPDANQSSSIGIRGTIGYTPPEYGLGNEVSTSGDMYSFGILLLELLLTGKRPTNDMFKGSYSLHNFVKQAFPKHIIDVLDHTLLEDVQGKTTTSVILESLTSILEIALSCSTDMPEERSKMSDVAIKLSSIRNKLFQTRSEQNLRT